MPPRARTTAKTPKRAQQQPDEPAVIDGDVIDSTDEPDPDHTADEADEADETGETGEEMTLVGAIVPFHGRDIAVKLPSLEQLVVMRRLADQYKDYGPDGSRRLGSVEEALNGYDRVLMTITSVVVNPADVEFVENLLLQGKDDLTGAGVLLRSAMNALSEANKEQINRAERRRQASTRPAGSKGTARLATR